jgi:hypothetical protein
MQMASPTLLLIGLENGGLAGWDLGANRIDNLPAHSGPSCAISHLQKFSSLIFTGDYAGRVQIRNSANNYQLLIPECQTMI